jgi:hypothetical protein
VFQTSPTRIFAPKVHPRGRSGAMAKKAQAAARQRKARTADAKPGGVGPGAGGADPGLRGSGPELDALRDWVKVASGNSLREFSWGVDLSDRVRVGTQGQIRISVDIFRIACLRRVEHAKGALDLASWGHGQGDGARGGGGGVDPATMAHYFWFNARDDAEHGGELPANFVEGMVSAARIGLRVLLWCYPKQKNTNVPPQVELHSADDVFREEAVHLCLARGWKIALVADVVRWLVAWHFGGWFADGDMLWLRPFPVAWGHPHYGHHFASMDATHRRGKKVDVTTDWATVLYLRHPTVRSWIATPGHYPRGSPLLLEAIRAALSLVPDREGRVLANRERATDFVVLGPLVMMGDFVAASGGVDPAASGGVDPATDPWASWRRLRPLLKLKGTISASPPEYLIFMELLRCLVTRWGLEGAVEPPGVFFAARGDDVWCDAAATGGVRRTWSRLHSSRGARCELCLVVR